MRIQSGNKKLLNKKHQLDVIRFGGFVPTDIAGCVLWLRSDLGITKDGADKVSAWADQSGNGNDVEQAGAGNQPLWIDAQINGYPCIRTDGIDDFLSAVFVLNQPTEVYAVVKEITYVSGMQLWDGGAVPNQMALYTHTNPPELKLYAGAWGAAHVGPAAGNWFLVQALYAGISSLIRTNGGGPTAEGDIGANNGQGITIGGCVGARGNSDFAEVIIYDSALSDPNRLLVETYLNGRYAIY